MVEEGSFARFLGEKGRAYFVSEAPQGDLLTGRELYGCNCYASGEKWYSEDIFVRSWRHMLEFFENVDKDGAFKERYVQVRPEMIITQEPDWLADKRNTV